MQAYNAQASVNADSQVIVAQGLSNNGAEAQQRKPMVARIEANSGRQAAELSAAAGYCSEENHRDLSLM